MATTDRTALPDAPDGERAQPESNHGGGGEPPGPASRATLATLLGDATRRHVRSPGYLAAAAILVVAAAIMAFIPLFHVVGYGFAFATAILASGASLLSGARLARRVLAGLPALPALARPGGPAFLAAVLRRSALVALALLVLPLALMTGNGLRVRNCDWLFGLEAYAILPGLSVILASSLGVLVGLLCPRRRAVAIVLCVACLLASLAYGVWRFYAAPPVFSYNLFAGYFPGNLYDEGLALHAPLLWARLYHVAAMTALVGLFAVFFDVSSGTLARGALARGLRAPATARSQLVACAVTVIAGSLAITLYALSGSLGFDIEARDIERFLGGRHDTEHFTIYYPPGGEIERDIHILAEEHEYRYDQIVATLGVPAPGRITSFYFATPEDKHRMMGAAQVYMAKPWRSEIYLNHQPFPHDVLRHEIAHVVASSFGSPVFRVSAGRLAGLPLLFNVGLIEGLAVAVDWPNHSRNPLTPHQSVKALRELGMAPPVDRLLSTQFLSFSSSRSYTMAGSFVRFLLDSRGAGPLRVLYGTGGDFAAAYGSSQAAMIGEWNAMIEGIELPDGAAETVREMFRRPSIFARPCPDAIARQRKEMGDLVARGDLAGAAEIATRVCREAPSEPIHQLELADILTRAGESEQAAAIYRTISSNTTEMSSSLRARALWNLAALAMRAKDRPEVARLLDQAVALPLPDDEQRLSVVQRFAASYTGPAGDALRAYLWGYDPSTPPDPLVLIGRAAETIFAEPGLALGHYLLGRLLHGRGVPDEAAALLARALDIGDIDATVRTEAARLLAEAGYLAHDTQLVERAAAVLMEPGQAEVDQRHGADWLERLAWKRVHARKE